VNVTFATCVYEDPDRILAGLGFLPPQSEILCVDNSASPSPALERALGRGYEWSGGKNLRYAASLNRLVARASHPYFIYACLGHCEMRDASWWRDLLAPLADPNCALTGSLRPGPWEYAAEHIQGGIFAARTELLRKYPFSDRYPHDFSDIAQSEALRREGYHLADVPGVQSLHPGVSRTLPVEWKIIHRSRPRGRMERVARMVTICAERMSLR
jgi:hypothetical protein